MPNGISHTTASERETERGGRKEGGISYSLLSQRGRQRDTTHRADKRERGRGEGSGGDYDRETAAVMLSILRERKEGEKGEVVYIKWLPDLAPSFFLYLLFSHPPLLTLLLLLLLFIFILWAWFLPLGHHGGFKPVYRSHHH